jgi:N-acetylmuramoyl-L-alanine amidase
MLALAVAVALVGVGDAQGQPLGSPPKAHGDHPHPPPIDNDPIPYGSKRKAQMAGYSRRHYGKREWRLRSHRAIVLHFTDTSTYGPVWNTFASNDPNLGESPGVCSHFVVGKEGNVHELVQPNVRCRHTIGLNQLSIGIEMVQEEGRGSHWADRQILQRRHQSDRAVRLVAWLKSRFGIKMRNVIGHSMANSSPLFEDQEGWQNDHTDWQRQDVETFRHRVRRLLRR